jgi:murein DD-endopeptidase MepM/ murein hydrolase activator NlpD
MRIVGKAKGITLYAPDDAYFSYFNSPYIGHDIGSAVDIYPRQTGWGEAVVSPVSGKIVRIRKMKMGQPKQFPTSDVDYGIGIQPDTSETNLVRVMHCEPAVKNGESVSAGDELGTAIRSRFFNYWTGPHLHVEVIPQDAFLRSSKSFPLELKYHYETKAVSLFQDAFDFEVISVTEDNIIGYANDLGHAKIGELIGHPAVGEGTKIEGILDGGFSHYKIGGVIGASSLEIGSSVNLMQHPLGRVAHAKPGASLFRRGPSVQAFLDEHEIHGLSCFIYTQHFTKKGRPQLILIPKQYGEFQGALNEGDICELRIAGGNNTVKAELTK